MPTDLDAILREIRARHVPRPGASAAAIAAFEGRVGWTLDEEQRAFYLACDGASLFPSGNEARCRLLSLAEIERARTAIFGRDDDQWGDPGWWVVVDVLDGNYIMLHRDRCARGLFTLHDCFHETFHLPEASTIVATSLVDFLHRALTSRSGQYWLDAEFVPPASP